MMSEPGVGSLVSRLQPERFDRLGEREVIDQALETRPRGRPIVEGRWIPPQGDPHAVDGVQADRESQLPERQTVPHGAIEGPLPEVRVETRPRSLENRGQEVAGVDGIADQLVEPKGISE